MSLSWIISNWKLVGVGLLAVALLIGKFWLDGVLAERDQLRADNVILAADIAGKTRAIAALEEERAAAFAMTQQVQTIRERVYVAPEGGCVGDAVRSALDGLRGITPAPADHRP